MSWKTGYSSFIVSLLTVLTSDQKNEQFIALSLSLGEV